MGVMYIYIFISCLRPIGLNVLGYQSHVLQRCHPTFGHEASCHLTLSATEARTKYLILSRIELSTPHYLKVISEITTSSTRAKKADRAHVVV